jgi:hypothetical protein
MKIIYNYIKSLYRKFIFPASIKLSKNTSVIDLIKNFNYDIKTIIEIGASNGRYTKILKNKFPKSFIFCIEANKDLKDNFLKNTINCKNVSLEAIGIGSKNEIKTFYKELISLKRTQSILENECKYQWSQETQDSYDDLVTECEMYESRWSLTFGVEYVKNNKINRRERKSLMQLIKTKKDNGKFYYA